MICCCIDLTPCFGEQIKAAPSSLCGLKKFLCFGGPCYMSCSYPLFSGVKNGASFLSKWDEALKKYAKKNGIDQGEMCIFEVVKDSEIDFHGAKKANDTE